MSDPVNADNKPPKVLGRRQLRRLWRKLCCFAQADAGVSAVEFALLAPTLIFALIATVDVGRALTERMTVDYVLRAGAQSAAAGRNATAIDQVLRTTAARNFTVAPAGAAGDDRSLSLQVSRLCSCAEQPGTAVACSVTCAGNAPTQIFYSLKGEKTYSGILLPRLRLSRALQVQVR